MPTEDELRAQAEAARTQSEADSAKAEKLEEAADLTARAEEAREEAENS